MSAEEYYEIYGLEQGKEVFNQYFSTETISLHEVWDAVVTGNYQILGQDLFLYLRENTIGELEKNADLLSLLLILGFLSVTLQYLSILFSNTQTMDLAKQVMGIGLFLCSFQVLFRAMNIAEQLLKGICQMSMVVLPIYLISMSLAFSFTMANAFAQIYSIVMFVSETVILKFLLPFMVLIKTVHLLDFSFFEERMQTAIGYMEKGILYLLRGILCGISACSFVQSNILSASASVKRTSFESLANLLPGIGKLTEESIDLFLSSSTLVFRCMGGFVSALLFLLCFFPFLRLVLILVILRVTEALYGMMGEKKMKKGICIAGNSVEVLLRMTFDGLCIFLAAIAIAGFAAGR